MQRQKGLTLMSTLIVAVFLAAALILGLKCVPVFSEYFAVKKALNNVARSVDVSSPPQEYRKAFQKYADVDDIESVDAQTIVITKENGKAFLSVDYRRYVKLFSVVSLVFDFEVTTDGTRGAAGG